MCCECHFMLTRNASFFIKQQQFPKKLPMSQSVPQIYSQVKEFIYASLKFSESLHRRWADSTHPACLFLFTQNEDADGNTVIKSCHSSLVSMNLWSCYCDTTVFMGSPHVRDWTVFKSTTLPSTSSHPFWQCLFSLSSEAFGWLLWGVCVVLVTGTPNSFPEG